MLMSASAEDNISRYTGHRSSPVLFDDLDLKKRGYNQWVAYGQSKTANIYMANEIERRFGSKGGSSFLSSIPFQLSWLP